MLNSVSLPGCTDVDLYPSALRPEIDEVNALVYDQVSHDYDCAVLGPASAAGEEQQQSQLDFSLDVQINNGVYKSGFSTKQAAYDKAQQELYSALETVESRLSQHRFLVGDK